MFHLYFWSSNGWGPRSRHSHGAAGRTDALASLKLGPFNMAVKYGSTFPILHATSDQICPTGSVVTDARRLKPMRSSQPIITGRWTLCGASKL
jgi:hypothetical protein